MINIPTMIRLAMTLMAFFLHDYRCSYCLLALDLLMNDVLIASIGRRRGCGCCCCCCCNCCCFGCCCCCCCSVMLLKLFLVVVMIGVDVVGIVAAAAIAAVAEAKTTCTEETLLGIHHSIFFVIIPFPLPSVIVSYIPILLPSNS